MTRREWLTALGGVSALLAADALSATAAQQPGGRSGDLTALSMAELARAYAAGSVTPLDVTAAYLARIDRENPGLGAS